MPVMVPFSWKFFLALVAIQLCTTTAYNVVDFGARGDGKTDSTSAFLQAWRAACNSNKPSTVSIPHGTFLVKSISFTGPCKNEIQVRIDGTIVAPDDYKAFGSDQFWIMFYRVSRLSVIGGTLDAKGSSLWSCKSGGKNNCPFGARSISFQGCSNLLVSGLKSYNSQRMHIAINQCSNIILQKVKIIAPSGSPNTDGIHIQSSRGVTVTNSNISTGDDCISIGPGSINLWIEKIACGPGHGISIGSLGKSTREDGVENVVVTDSVFTRTENGVRVKSWPKASDGYAKNLVFKNLVMRNVSNPIIIDQDYCPHKNCPHKSSGVRVSQVTYKNIKGTSLTQNAITFRCSPTNPCQGIRLQNVNLTYINQLKKPTLSYCENAGVLRAVAVFPKCCL